jgi:type VI secretion system protein VasG
MEGATVFCKVRGNPYVELVHWFQQILQAPDSDLLRIVTRFGIDTSRLAADIVASLDRLPRGATSISNFSPLLEESIERGWVYGSLLYGERTVRTGHIFVGLVKTPVIAKVLPYISGEFAKIQSDALTDDFAKIVNDSPESVLIQPVQFAQHEPTRAVNFCPACGFNLRGVRMTS